MENEINRNTGFSSCPDGGSVGQPFSVGLLGIHKTCQVRYETGMRKKLLNLGTGQEVCS